MTKLGKPAGLQGMVFSISNVCIQSSLNALGSDAIAASSAALNYEYFAYYILSSFAQAAVLLFFAYTGFEVIAIAAEDMKNPKKEFTTCYYHVYATCIHPVYGNPRRIYWRTRY